MSDNVMERLLEAKKYQREAFMALFTESTKRHAEIVERELKCMVKEGMLEVLASPQGMEILRTVMMNFETTNTESNTESNTEAEKGTKEHKTKKVKIN